MPSAHNQSAKLTSRLAAHASSLYRKLVAVGNGKFRYVSNRKAIAAPSHAGDMYESPDDPFNSSTVACDSMGAKLISNETRCPCGIPTRGKTTALANFKAMLLLSSSSWWPNPAVSSKGGGTINAFVAVGNHRFECSTVPGSNNNNNKSSVGLFNPACSW